MTYRDTAEDFTNNGTDLAYKINNTSWQRVWALLIAGFIYALLEIASSIREHQ